MSSDRPRVLFVGAFPLPQRAIFGGMVTSCLALLQSSFPARLELDLLDSTQATHPPPGLAVRLVLAAQRLARYVYRFERRKPDAVLLFAAIGASLVEKGAMAWYARLRGVPAVMFPRGGGIIDACRASRFTFRWVKVAFRGSRMVFCQSARWQDFAVNVLGLAREDAPIIPNWTASPQLLAVGQRRRKRDAGPVRLLFLGWLDREKGVLELLEACRELARDRSFTLDIAGEGNVSNEAREFSRQHGLDVRYRGWLRGEALHEVLAASDVLVLPSWAEGLPNAMIEAMAARLAVVVTAVGSVPDVVTHEREALLVPPRNAELLRVALARVIDDAALRERLADSAFAMAAKNFGVESAVGLMVRELYRATGRTAVSSV